MAVLGRIPSMPMPILHPGNEGVLSHRNDVLTTAGWCVLVLFWLIMHHSLFLSRCVKRPLKAVRWYMNAGAEGFYYGTEGDFYISWKRCSTEKCGKISTNVWFPVLYSNSSKSKGDISFVLNSNTYLLGEDYSTTSKPRIWIKHFRVVLKWQLHKQN